MLDLKPGDYGLIDRRTGVFEKTGSIYMYDDALRNYLHNSNLRSPTQAEREECIIIASKVNSKRKADFSTNTYFFDLATCIADQAVYCSTIPGGIADCGINFS